MFLNSSPGAPHCAMLLVVTVLSACAFMAADWDFGHGEAAPGARSMACVTDGCWDKGITLQAATAGREVLS